MNEQEEEAYTRGQEALAARLIGVLARDAVGEARELALLITESHEVAEALRSCCEQLGVDYDPDSHPADIIRRIEREFVNSEAE